MVFIVPPLCQTQEQLDEGLAGRIGYGGSGQKGETA
jgi:hypothetical protein